MEKIVCDKVNGEHTENARSMPSYMPPRIITYTSEEILDQIGPAYACSPSPCALSV